MTAPICPYCKEVSVLTSGAQLYGHRPDLADKEFYHCMPCKAWVGVHAMTGEPLGTLANSKLRKLRSEVHAIFDPIWKDPANTDFVKSKNKLSMGQLVVRYRTKAYSMLSTAMKLPPEACHIGMFNEEQCRQAIDIINSREIFRSR